MAPLKQLKELETLVEEAGLADATIWGVPLITTTTVLLKFLKARAMDPKLASQMIANTINWRQEFGIDGLSDKDIGVCHDLNEVAFIRGYDKKGHPVWYNVFGEFQKKELYAKMFGDAVKKKGLLWWRICLLERSVRMLDLKTGDHTILQVVDLKDVVLTGWKELQAVCKQEWKVVLDYYPGFVFKQVFINVPWWYKAFYTMIRTRSKIVYGSPTKTLYKYISPEQVPVQYGGLSRLKGNSDFSIDDPATEITIKPEVKHIVEIQVHEMGTFVWELLVLGWGVTCSAEFVPDNSRYARKVLQKPKRMAGNHTDDRILSHSFEVTELGKVLLIIDNQTMTTKKLVYRFILKA